MRLAEVENGVLRQRTARHVALQRTGCGDFSLEFELARSGNSGLALAPARAIRRSTAWAAMADCATTQ
jgi:hypothetical protein